jgi:hypothetical protein
LQAKPPRRGKTLTPPHLQVAQSTPLHLEDMENLRKKNKTKLQNKTDGQSSKIEQTEDRISKLEDEMVIKGKTEELLSKQLKTCEKKM